MDCKKTKKVAFKCPHHGILTDQVEYMSAKFGSKMIVDIPVMYCKSCKIYYTPFSNLLALTNITYKGHRVSAAIPVLNKSDLNREVFQPQIISLQDFAKIEDKKRLQRLKRAEDFKDYLTTLREVDNTDITLSNKSCFLEQQCCPNCFKKTTKEHVKITQGKKYIVGHVRHCQYCDLDLIAPKQFYTLCAKAEQVIHGYFHSPFIIPIGINCEHKESDEYLFIPEEAMDSGKYNHRNMPSRFGKFYDMTDEEYNWLRIYYLPAEFPLRAKSFLSEAGYSTNESEVRRRSILLKCVSEHGKAKVIKQLKSNMNLRMRQKDGIIRYANAINIWRSDILYVETKL